MTKVHYRITDTETVGLHAPAAPASGVVEIAYIEIDPDTLDVLHTFSARVNPGCAIDPGASAVHGIFMEHVAHEPELHEVFYPEEPVINIGHNTPYDLRFLKPYYQNLVGSFCTLSAARKLLIGPPNYKLQTLAEHFNLPKGAAHSALGDVQTTLELLRLMVNHTGRSLKSLIDASRKPQIYHKMPFGRFRDAPLLDLPVWYIKFFDDKDIDIDLRHSLDQVKRLRGIQ